MQHNRILIRLIQGYVRSHAVSQPSNVFRSRRVLVRPFSAAPSRKNFNRREREVESSVQIIADGRSSINVEAILKNIKLKPINGKSHSETENDGLRHSLSELRQYRAFFDITPKRVARSSMEARFILERLRQAESVKDVDGLIELLKSVSELEILIRKKVVEEPVFSAFVDLLRERLSSNGPLSFPQMHTLLRSFYQMRFDQFPHQFAPANILRSAIDSKAVESSANFTRQQGFMLSDLWYLASCARLAQYPQIFIAKQRPSVETYSPQELIRLLLAVTFQRSADPGFMLQIERLILPHISALSSPELAVLAAGFFKTQTQPGPELVEKFLNRLLELDVSELADDVVIPISAKFLSKYGQPSQHPSMNNFVTKVKPNITRLTVTSLAHVAGILEVTLHDDENFLDRITGKLVDGMKRARLKDLAKITRTCSVLDDRPIVGGTDFFDAVLQFTDSDLSLHECLRFPSKAIELLAALARADKFSERLIDFVSSPVFLREYQDQGEGVLVDDDLLQLHYAVQLRNSSGSTGRPGILSQEILQKIVSQQQAKEGALNTALVSLRTGLRTLLNIDEAEAHKFVAVCHPLPYAERMILVRMNGLEALPLPDNVFSKDAATVKFAPENGTCFAICYHPWWSFTTPLRRLTGFHEMKLRHLRSIGYRVIPIDQTDTQNLTFVQKMKFLRDKLFFERPDGGELREKFEEADHDNLLKRVTERA